jgi:hypothetical protein
MTSPNRRDFLRVTAAAGAAGLLPAPTALTAFGAAPADDLPITTKNTTYRLLPAKAVTSGPKHHWFGYYDKCPWDKTGRYLLAMRADFVARQPTADEGIVLGRVDLQDGNRFLPFAATHAWCWQQGTMLQWMPDAPDRRVIYNVRQDGEFRSVVHDLIDDSRRTLPRPIYCVSPDATKAVSLDFGRLGRCRPGYGYEGVKEKFLADPAPAEDGLWVMDLKSGDSKLVAGYKQLADHKPAASFAGATHWFNHVVWNPSGTRFLWLHRWGQPGKKWTTRLYTADPDGGRLRLLNDYGMTSHFDWRDDSTILAWANGPKGNHYYLITDSDEPAEKRHEVVGDGVLTRDGHCTYTPDRKWILTDTYVDEKLKRNLILYHPGTNTRIDIGRFLHPKALLGPWRCDPHPRFNRDGTQVCIDSGHEATRQIYVLDVAEVLRSQS